MVDCQLACPANPVEQFLRSDRIPHIFCPGCGIGTTVNCFSRALLDSKADLRKIVVVSGIGCTGRVAGYLRLDSFPWPPALKCQTPI
jgi:2-oxoglutarate ferredoxin oxidoreductase subunit beta